MTEEKNQKSKLVSMGILLIILSFMSRPIANIARSMNAGNLKAIVFFSTDALWLCFFTGMVCLIIGTIRNRKLKK